MSSAQLTADFRWRTVLCPSRSRQWHSSNTLKSCLIFCIIRHSALHCTERIRGQSINKPFPYPHQAGDWFTSWTGLTSDFCLLREVQLCILALISLLCISITCWFWFSAKKKEGRRSWYLGQLLTLKCCQIINIFHVTAGNNIILSPLMSL